MGVNRMTDPMIEADWAVIRPLATIADKEHALWRAYRLGFVRGALATSSKSRLTLPQTPPELEPERLRSAGAI